MRSQVQPFGSHIAAAWLPIMQQKRQLRRGMALGCWPDEWVLLDGWHTTAAPLVLQQSATTPNSIPCNRSWVGLLNGCRSGCCKTAEAAELHPQLAPAPVAQPAGVPDRSPGNALQGANGPLYLCLFLAAERRGRLRKLHST